MSLERGAVRVERSERGDLIAVSATGARLRIGAGGEQDPAGESWQPVELLMVALAGCMVLDVASILEKKRHQGVEASLTVTPGTRDSSLPGRPLQSLRVEHQWVGPMADESLSRAVALAAERYCTVQLTLERVVQVEHAVALRSTLPGASQAGISSPS